MIFILLFSDYNYNKYETEHLKPNRNLNVAKYYLGEVNLKTMLVSGHSTKAAWDGRVSSAGAPCGLYMQLLACNYLQQVICLALSLPAVPSRAFCPLHPPFKTYMYLGQVSIKLVG